MEWGKPLPEKETPIVGKIRDYLDATLPLGAVIEKNHGSPYSTKGRVDVEAFFRFRGSCHVLAIEVKVPGKDLEPEQRVYRDRCQRAGAWYLMATDVEGVRRTLDEQGYLAEQRMLRKWAEDVEDGVAPPMKLADVLRLPPRSPQDRVMLDSGLYPEWVLRLTGKAPESPKKGSKAPLKGSKRRG